MTSEVPDSAPGSDSSDTPADSSDTPADTLGTTGETAPEELALDRAAAIRAVNVASLARAREVTAAAGVRTYDWGLVRRRYVEGVKGEGDTATEWPTLDAVAEHFGAPASNVRTHAGKEGWRAQRTQWQAQIESTRRQARAAALSKEATQLDTSALTAAKMGLQLSTHRLAEIARQRDVVPPDAQEMQRWAQAIDLFHKIGLRAVGDPELHRVELTGVNGRPIEIAAELRRDDPGRLAGVLGVLAQAGLGDLFGAADQRVLEGELAAREDR